MRVLHVIGAMDRGGAETMIMNIYRSIDTSQVQFDFLVHETRECDYDAEILARGGRIFRVERLTSPAKISSYYRSVYNLIKAHPEWDIVHGHIGSSAAIYLRAARKLGRVAVAHAHSKHFPLSFSELAFRILAYPTRFVAHEFIGCSQEAGYDRYGRGVVSGTHFRVLRNGILVDAYRFDADVRERIRSAWGIDADALVLGHVGRLSAIKNHPFLFDVFQELLQVHPDVYLVCVGRGEDEADLRAQVSARGLSERVIFAGVRDDIPQVLMAFDMFCFPSLSEGLPVSCIEAQASGLPCVISTGVPDEVLVGTNALRLDLSAGAHVWCEELEKLFAQTKDRCLNLKLVKDAGYDVAVSALELVSWYQSWLSKYRK